MVTGESMTYVAGAGEPIRVDLPRADGTYRAAHQPRAPKPTGLNWTALMPACTSCSGKSSQIDDTGLCPSCRGTKPATDPKTTTKATAPTRAAHKPPQQPPHTAAAGQTTTPASERGGGGRPAAPPRKGKPRAQPASSQVEKRQPTQEVTVTAPPFPTYIVDIAIVMRDSEAHPDPDVRHARKQVANALMGLNREFTRVGAPVTATRTTTTHPSPGQAPRKPRSGGHGSGKLAPHQADIIRRYAAGESASAIARSYDATPQSVLPLLRRAGITIRPRTTNQSGATA